MAQEHYQFDVRQLPTNTGIKFYLYDLKARKDVRGKSYNTEDMAKRASHLIARQRGY